jgi:flagellar biosynthesis/type III secretory pathway chaperone
MGALLRLQDERSQLLRMAGYPTDNAGMLLLIRDCDPARELPPRWAECAELAKRCRALNDHNGALVSSRMRRIQGVLEVLTGSREGPNVYGRQAEQHWVQAGRMLATEV